MEVAATSLRRAWGLLGRKKIVRGEGLWIKPSSGVHTFFMQFPIDVIGLDRKGKVRCICERVVPYRIAALRWNVHSILELPPGTVETTGTAIGDVLQFRDSTL